MRLLPLLALLALLALPARGDGLAFVSVGAGELGGGYYRTAAALCARVNRVEPARLRCSPEATAGSIYNLRALGSGQLDMAIAQSDWSLHARAGTSVFAGAGPAPALRAVAALYVEPFTVLARRASGIARFEDLAGRRVDIGHPSSGRRATMEAAMARFGMTRDSFAEVHELQAGAVLTALCEGRIDATVLTVGQPSALVAQALERCDAVLTPVAGPAVDALLQANPAYIRATIRPEIYGAAGAHVATFGVKALLLTTAEMDDAVVAAFTRSLIDGADGLGREEAVLSGLTPAFMTGTDALIPLHPAARAALEAGAR